MVEFVVGLVAVLVLVGAILQLASLGYAQTRVTQDATRAASLAAMLDTYTDPAPPPMFVHQVSRGGDGKTYTRDDFRVQGDPDLIHREILAHAHADDIQAAVGSANIMSVAAADPTLVESFGLVRGYSLRSGIPVIPVVRRLLYRADRIDMDQEVWSVWTQGLY